MSRRNVWEVELEREREGLRAAWERALDEMGVALVPAVREGMFQALWEGVRGGSFEIALWEKAISQAGGGG